jgi:hypothetical protein
VEVKYRHNNPSIDIIILVELSLSACRKSSVIRRSNQHDHGEFSSTSPSIEPFTPSRVEDIVCTSDPYPL